MIATGSGGSWPEHRVNQACFGAALLITVGWFLVYNHFRPDYLVDEAGHLSAVYHFLEGKPGWPEHVTMLPGYHYIITALWQLHPPIKLLTLARLVTLLTALVGLGAFAAVWQRVHGRPAGRATLLLAVLPLLQPFTGMAYSDVPALAFLLVAVSSYVAGHRALAAGLFVASALIRQTNLVWAGFLMAWEAGRLLAFRAVPTAAAQSVDEQSASSPNASGLSGYGQMGSGQTDHRQSGAAHGWWAAGREFLRRTSWLGAVLVLAAGIVALAGRVTLGTQTGTSVQANIATLHTAALLILILGLPVWLAAAPGIWREGLRVARAFPGRSAAFLTVCATATAVLALTFRNPHMWNRDLFWDGCTFTLLRNWPLVAIDTHPWLRVASGLNVVAMSLAVALTFSRQRFRLELWLSLLFGAVLPAVNYLVEPRYLIPAFVFVLLFLQWSPGHWRRVVLWWTLLCAVHAPFVARGLSLW